MAMRQSQLRAFHNVAVHGGFSRAAEALFLTQPAISDQVRKLEQEHDVLLFFRERKRIRLTPEGERLFAMTKEYFDVEDRITEYMSEARAVVDGSLRIIVDSAHHVTEILGRFREKHSNVFVSVRTGNSEEVLSALRNYNAEIGIVGNLGPGTDLDTVELGSSPIIACAARGICAHPRRGMTLKEISELPLIFRERGSKTRQKLEDEAFRQNVLLKPAIEAEGREAMHEVIASGAGIGFVSEAEFGNDDRLERIELLDVDITMNETLVHLSQRRDVRVIRAFVEFANA